jgi:hypothetical protein
MAKKRKKKTHLDEIDLGETVIIARSLDVEDRNNVLVVEISQQLHLSQCSETEHGMVKGSDLFDGYFLARRLMQRRAVHARVSRGFLQMHAGFQLPDDTVCALANDILNIVLVGHVEGDLSRPSLGVLTLSHGGSLESA